MSPDIVFGGALALILAAIAAIDIRRLIIPDALNATLALTGIAYVVVGGALPAAGLYTGVISMLLLWLLREWFIRVRGVVALGLGDVKMIGAAAFWISPWNMPLLLIVACLAALAWVAAATLAHRGIGRDTPIPFGAFIAAGLMLTWLLETTSLPTLLPDG